LNTLKYLSSGSCFFSPVTLSTTSYFFQKTTMVDFSPLRMAPPASLAWLNVTQYDEPNPLAKAVNAKRKTLTPR